MSLCVTKFPILPFGLLFDVILENNRKEKKQ